MNHVCRRSKVWNTGETNERCTSFSTYTARSYFLSTAQGQRHNFLSSASTATGAVAAFALIAVTAIYRATLGRLEGHFSRSSALSARRRVELAGAAATAAVAAAVTHTSTSSATTGESARLPLCSAIGASFGFIGEPAFRVPSLVFAGVDEFRTTVRARNVLV